MNHCSSFAILYGTSSRGSERNARDGNTALHLSLISCVRSKIRSIKPLDTPLILYERHQMDGGILPVDGELIDDG